MSRIVRATASPGVHLTFDDGPVAGCTERVLDLLECAGQKATFFVIVEKARREKAILDRIRRSGHAIGNHSLDHRYSPFFAPRAKLKEWISKAHDELGSLWGDQPVGFRPPAGVCTPPLRAVLADLGIPLILWDLRFYDAVLPWGNRRARKAAGRLSAGTIVLLHDSHRGSRADRFLGSLELFLGKMRFPSHPLSASLIPPVTA